MERVVGIDAGIASVGWAVLEGQDGDWRIVGCGTRTFDAPETDKERRPTNSIRREKRGMRRVIRRRRQRIATAAAGFRAPGRLLPVPALSAAVYDRTKEPRTQDEVERITL